MQKCTAVDLNNTNNDDLFQDISEIKQCGLIEPVVYQKSGY